jgi:hypothetical protein
MLAMLNFLNQALHKLSLVKCIEVINLTEIFDHLEDVHYDIVNAQK